MVFSSNTGLIRIFWIDDDEYVLNFCGHPRKRPAFVILTGWARELFSTDIDSAYYVDAFLEKPVEMRQHLKKLAEIIAIRRD